MVRHQKYVLSSDLLALPPNNEFPGDPDTPFFSSKLTAYPYFCNALILRDGENPGGACSPVKRTADSREQQQSSGAETGSRAPRMRPLLSSPAHFLDPASLGIRERDKGKGLKQHRTGKENNQLQRPAVALRQGKLSAAIAHLPARPGHGPQRASHCPGREMLRDFSYPKLRFSLEPSFELLDS